MKKIAIIATLISLFTASISLPVMATNPLTTFGDESDAIILKSCAGEADGVKCILNLVVDVMSIGVGILGVIAISVVGVQYLTAGDSEEQTRKAKRRLFEIVIGLAVYAIIAALLKFLAVDPPK